MSNTNTRKLTVVRKPNDQIHLEEGEAVHVGVDVHKASYSVALFSDRRGLIATWVQPARAEVLLERLRPIREGIAQVVYEAGPTSSALARRLRADGYNAQVIAPSKLLAPVSPEAKSDRLDCRRLAQLSAKGLLHPVRVPTEQEEADRQVLRLRELLVRKTHAVQSQIKSFLLQHGLDEPAGQGQPVVTPKLFLRTCLDFHVPWRFNGSASPPRPVGRPGDDGARPEPVWGGILHESATYDGSARGCVGRIGVDRGGEGTTAGALHPELRGLLQRCGRGTAAGGDGAVRHAHRLVRAPLGPRVGA